MNKSEETCEGRVRRGSPGGGGGGKGPPEMQVQHQLGVRPGVKIYSWTTSFPLFSSYNLLSGLGSGVGGA